MLVKAVRFAHEAHKGQCRKYNPVPYITHPLRVMNRAMLFTDDPEVLCAAVLHDVVEDCGITHATLVQTFSQRVADLVLALTNHSKLTHPHANRAERQALDHQRIAGIPREAKLIKLIDRIDNLNEIPPTEGFLKKYQSESTLLLEVLRGTHSELEAELESLCLRNS